MQKRKTLVEKKERKLEKELFWIIGFALILVIIFLIASAIFRGFNTFEYEGLTFTKEKVGNIPVYHYYYYFTNKENKLVQYNLFLRNDPRENDIPVDGEIILRGKKEVYISTNSSGLKECRYAALAVGDLASFLGANDFEVKGANADFWDAGLKGQDYATCQSNPSDKVIMITEGSETKIKVRNACYTITVNNCEILEASEKFRFQSIIDAKEFDEARGLNSSN